MEYTLVSSKLGLLCQRQIQQLDSIKPTYQCAFLPEPSSFLEPAQPSNIVVQLRGEYVVQMDPKTSGLVCGFKCDYSINFQILRGTPHEKNVLGTPQAIQITFTDDGNRKVKLIAVDVGKLEQLAVRLEKKYIVHLGFREGFNAVKILGKGAAATVYKAIRFRDNKYVAIKSFKRSLYFSTENGKASFQKEFQILSSLSHPNICSLEGVYQSANSTYIVMENLQISLFGWIQKYGFPAYETGRKMIYQLLRAIQYLHSKGIMHRDLKLENIMVQIVIVDLGLAEYVNSKKFLYTRCGTPGYVAPQILRHKPNQHQLYNEACDIFSIGIIFHILLFKKPVFEGTDVKEVIKKNTECVINLGDYTLENQGVDLLGRLLEKDPKKRISATEAINHQFFQMEMQSKCEEIQFPIITINSI